MASVYRMDNLYCPKREDLPRKNVTARIASTGAKQFVDEYFATQNSERNSSAK